MFKKIVVPLDGSELSESVFPWVRTLAKKESDSEVLLLRTFEPPSTVYLLPELAVPTSNFLSDDFLSGQLLDYLVKQGEKLEGCRVETKITIGEAAAEILAEGEKADLIVMASHGRGGLGRWLMGSVATKVVRGASVPVLVVGGKVLEETPPRQAALQRVVVPVDGSEPAERAFEIACKLVRTLGGSLHVYTGVSQVEIGHQLALETNRAGLAHFETYQSELVAGVEDIEIACTVKETYGKAGIAGFADSIDADLILMGSHGRGGLERWLLGSQTEKTLQRANCPVLITH